MWKMFENMSIALYIHFNLNELICMMKRRKEEWKRSRMLENVDEGIFVQ